MKRNRKNKKILLVVLVVAIASMSVVFAAMSTTLKIKGSGLLSADAWNIKFENLAGVTLKGTAEETTAPTIKTDTEIGDYRVVFKRTGDEVVYNFDVHNYGSMNAKIEELNMPLPVCTGNATDEEQKIADAQLVSESLTYTLTYSDGEEVKVGDTLKAEEIKSLTLRLAYTGENMPSESVEITGLNIEVKYVQDMSTGGEKPEGPSVDPETIAGKRFDEETKIVLDGIPVTIPGGATISALPGEYESVDDGLVAYIIPETVEMTDWNADDDSNGIIDVQEKYDQFVWIPVENAIFDLSDNADALSSENNIKAAVQSEIDAGRYPMAIKKDENDYIGVLYGFRKDSETNSIKVIPYSYWRPIEDPSVDSGSDAREPDYFKGNNFSSDYYRENVTMESMKEDFKNMTEKVYQKGGFWVGRYESSNADDTVKVTRGKTDLYNTWYEAYRKNKLYGTELPLMTSSMIYSCQWDQIMIWMKEIENTKQSTYFILNSKTMGWWDKRFPTGGIGKEVKNIFELGGNALEWSMSGISGTRIQRGGRYGEPSEYWGENIVRTQSEANATAGCRMTLY